MPRRQPPQVRANQATWSIIIGALLGVVLFLGSAYAGNSLAALVIVASLIAYVVVLMAVGRLNVFHILWGGTVDEDDPETRTAIVLPATLAIAALTLGIFIFDLASAESWGLFSWIAAAIALGYLAYIGIHISQSSPSNE